MKKFLPLLTLLISITGFSQTVSIPDLNNTSSDLVNTLLNNACVEVSNQQVSSLESVAYFNNGGGDFPIEEGVMIRTGNASITQGNYTEANLSSQLNNNSDEALEAINEASGQSSILTDVAFLEFEFTPLSSNFQFDFLFASNEYGEWQCVSSDVFAFLLTNLETGETQNLAVIPGTSVPISVKNIKDNTYNTSCESDYPELFGSYEVNNASNSTVNMRGYTKKMSASAAINPGTAYKIRLVIADSNDANFDSAIFLDAGSFTTSVDLGADKTICAGDFNSISTGLDETEYNHSWTYNGQVIPGLTTNTIQASQTGTYGVLVTKEGTNCLITDNVTFLDLEFQSPADVVACYTGESIYWFDLTENNAANLGVDNEDYELHYFASAEDLANLNPISSEEIENYESVGNHTVFVKLYNSVSGNYCATVGEFNLLISAPLNLQTPAPIQICTVEDVDTQIPLSQANALIVTESDLSNFNFTYFSSAENAENNNNPIDNPNNFEVPYGQDTAMVWVRVQEGDNASCYNIIPVEFILNNPPEVSELEDVTECESFILPAIQYGQYYSSPNGQGEQLPEGYEVIESSTIYIFNGPDENGCTNQTSFKVILIIDYEVEKTHCGFFKVPFPPAGEFYTAPGGPNGDGDLLPSNSYLYESQTIYFYAEIDGEFCREEAFDIEILPLPPVDEPENVVTCGSYTLPILQNGTYFTEGGGNGNILNGGETISETQTFYIYSDDGTCDNEHEFTVAIVPEFEDLVVCGGYELPSLPMGGFYAQAEGQGEEIAEGTYIENSQTIYYYTETTTTPNCTNNTSFYVQVKPIPPVDNLPGIVLCEDETYTLPSLVNGQYFTESNREGDVLTAGAVITSTQTIYINNEENGCTNETSFVVEIRSYPEVSNFTDVYTCDAYELPVIENGLYFTESLAQGEQLLPGDIIYETQTIYLYNEYEDLQGCYQEDTFTVYVEGVNLETAEDVMACESYMLPPLSVGHYFTESGGEGNLLNPGYTITSDREIFIYAKNGTRFVCETEVSFMVTIVKPDLNDFEDVERCGNYTLETLNIENATAGYYWQPNGQDPISSEELAFDTPGSYQVYIYATSLEIPDCSQEKAINITIYERPQLYVEGGTICRDAATGEVLDSAYLISGLDPSEYEVNWYLNDQLVFTGAEFEAMEAGEYLAEVIKLSPEVGADCNYLPALVVVEESAKPIINATVTEPFEDVANIEIEIVKGYGSYEYSLDGGAYQTSNIFQNVSSGPHEITVKGEFGGCGKTNVEMDVIKYPRFFTPNQDGINDTWNIFDLRFDRDAKVSIFDRYGKLITTLTTSGKGWGGVYHSKNMPSNDYWFLVDYVYEGQKRQFKSHFTLKR